MTLNGMQQLTAAAICWYPHLSNCSCDLQVSTSRQAAGDEDDPAAVVGAAKGRLVSPAFLSPLYCFSPADLQDRVCVCVCVCVGNVCCVYIQQKRQPPKHFNL